MENDTDYLYDYYDANAYSNQTSRGNSCSLFAFSCAVAMSILCLFGIFGNIFSFYVFTRQRMRSSINALLAGLSLVDTSVLIIAMPVYVVPGLNACDAFGPLEGLHIVTFFGLYQLAMMAQTCSIWTFVLISSERYLAVCKPLQAQRILSPRRAKFAQCSLLVLAAAYNFVRFWEYELIFEDLEESQGPTSGKKTKIGIVVGYARLLRNNETYFLGYYTISFMLVHFLIPFSIITILNAKIIKTILEAGRLRAVLTEGNRGGLDQQRQRQTTTMIIIVTAIFVVCNILQFVLNLWEAIDPRLFGDPKSRTLAFLVLDTSNLLVILNSAINFVVYFFYCRQYRRFFAKCCPVPCLKEERLERNDSACESVTLMRLNETRAMSRRHATTLMTYARRPLSDYTHVAKLITPLTDMNNGHAEEASE